MTEDTQLQHAAVVERASKFPIVEMRNLREARRSGPLNLVSPRRDVGELPRPREGHHVLVYKVDGRYVLDNVSLDRRDERVIKATQVSVVDTRRNTPVEVAFDIASGDDSTFTVLVTFRCTVTDPVLVVRDGLTDLHGILLTYVKSHHNAMQMGLDFSLAQINEVRRYVDAQLTAYKTVSPPFIDGLDVRIASAEVLTPAEVAELSAARRKRRNSHVLATEDLDYRSTHDADRERWEHEFQTVRQHNLQDRELDKRRYDQLIARMEQEHQDRIRLVAQQEELARRAELEQFRRDQLREAAELIGGDPERALHLAYAAGQLDPVAWADRLEAGREKIRIRADAEVDKDREERLAREREEHEDRMRMLEGLRAERLAELNIRLEDARADREEARERAALERRREQLEMQWKREDEVEGAKAARDAEQRRLDANLQLIRELAQRGHFDSVNVDLERLVAQLGGAAQAVAAGAADGDSEHPELPIGEAEVTGATSERDAEPSGGAAGPAGDNRPEPERNEHNDR